MKKTNPNGVSSTLHHGKSFSCKKRRWGCKGGEGDQPAAGMRTGPEQTAAQADRCDQGHERADASDGKWIPRLWDNWRAFRGKFNPSRRVTSRPGYTTHCTRELRSENRILTRCQVHTRIDEEDLTRRRKARRCETGSKATNAARHKRKWFLIL
jgi:hypothetical protein